MIAIFALSAPLLIRIGTAAIAVGLAVWTLVLSMRPQPPRIIFPVVMVVAGICVVGLGFSL
jgi:hypothetical protein